jgi:hypothetical protein
MDAHANGSAGEAEQHQPPLSISHLLVWTALSAAMMWLRTWEDRFAQARDIFGTSQVMWRAFVAIYSGACAGGLMVFASRRLRGMQFPVAPGDWIWVWQGVSVLSAMPLETAYWYCVKTSMQSSSVAATLVATQYFISAISFAVPAFFCQETGAWKWFLWTTAALVSLGAVGTVLSVMSGSAVTVKSWSAVSLVRHMVIAALLAWAVAADLRNHVRRMWSHWAGVLILAAGDGVQVVLEALSLWLGPR